MKNRSNALIGKQVSITADGNVTVKALQNSELYLIAASAAVSGSRTAAGGTLNVTVNGTEANVTVNDGTTIRSEKGSVVLNADTKEKLISVLASASAALGGTGAAGVLSVLVSGSKTVADIGKVTIYAKKDVQILATAVSKLFQINASVSGASQNAVGATVSVNVLNRKVLATVAAPSSITAEE